MSLTIHLSPELEARLKQAARERSLEPEQYITRLLEMTLLAKEGDYGHLWQTLPKEQWLATFRQWIESHDDINAPPLPAEALRRENLYEDRT